MERYMNLCIAEDDGKFRKRVEAANEMMRKNGVRLELADAGDGKILIGICAEIPEKQNKAGRKEKYSEHPMTVREAKEMIRDAGSKKTAEFMGIGRATLFRRLKKYGSDEDCPI